jgi:hypothetical protein
MSIKKSFAEKVKRAELMIAGVTNHLAELTHRGLDTAFVTEFNTRYNRLIDSHNAQQAYKARLKEETQAVTELRKQLKEYTRIAKRLVKLDLPQVSWVEFGILDKR